MTDETAINCFEQTSYYVKANGAIVEKATVRVNPDIGRERIASKPIVIGIAEKNNLIINLEDIEWDGVGRDKPDGIVHVVNGDGFWVEHTRIYDHYQHFINESLKEKTDKLLDALGAPKNLFIRYPDGTQTGMVSNFCNTWQDWETVESVKAAVNRVKEDDTAYGLKRMHGFRILSEEDNFPRVYFLETATRPMLEIIDKEVKAKEEKYGIFTGNTVLILDDETRSYSVADVMMAAREYSKTVNTSFRAIYVTSFSGLDIERGPNWVICDIKGY